MSAFPPATKARTQVASLLTIILAVSGCVLAARTIFGPFRFGLSVTNPTNSEALCGLSAVLLLILRAQPDKPRMVQQPDRWVVLWPFLTLLICGLAAWAWTFRFPFTADDYLHITNGLHSTGRYLANLFLVPPEDRFFRPLGLMAFAAEARCFGTDRLGWHAFSFTLHLVNSGLLYWIARRRGYKNWASLTAALFFLCHGSRPEAVTWVSAQFDLWAALFSFLALLAFLKHLENGRLAWQIATLAMLLLALLSKESAFVMPLVLGIVAWLDGRTVARGVLGFLRLAAPSFVLAGAVFLYRWSVLQGIGGYLMPGTGASFFLTVSPFRTTKALLLRLPAILFFPINWTRPPEWWLTGSLIAALAAIGVFASARLRGRELWFGLGFTLTTAALVHQFLLIGPDLEKARVLYLPCAGFALLLAAGLESRPPRVAATVACALMTFQVGALEHNLRIWRSVVVLEERTCASVVRSVASMPQLLAISDVPNVVDGVYFLHTGLRQCVEWSAGRPVPELLTPESAADGGSSVPRLVWDPAQRAFVSAVGAGPWK